MSMEYSKSTEKIFIFYRVQHIKLGISWGLSLVYVSLCMCLFFFSLDFLVVLRTANLDTSTSQLYMLYLFLPNLL